MNFFYKINNLDNLRCTQRYAMLNLSQVLKEEILKSKQSTPSVSTAEMAVEVDKWVDGLYGFSEAEILIIENSIK